MERSLRAARAATFAFFVINGFVMGMWIVHIPVVEHRVGISHAVLGWLLLLLGGGAFAGMRVAGPLTDRVGAHRVTPASAALCAAAVVLPGLATSPWVLGAALLVLGFGNGCLDVSMNAHAVQVEHGYGRPVMSAFHAVFSVGGVVASLLGALTLHRGWSAAGTLGVVALAGLAGSVLAAPFLLKSGGTQAAPDSANPRTATVDSATFAPAATDLTPQGHATPDSAAPGDAGAAAATPATRRRTSSHIWVLAGLAFMLMLCEGVANDWSTLHLRDVLDAPAATAALAYGCFATAMTAGRFAADRVAGRFGAVAVLRHGSAMAAVGLAAAAATHVVPLALAGWSLFGLGLSGCIPQLFSAAGHADQAAAGANVSRVAGLGYLGMLAGPAVIGPLTRFMPLNVALFLPVAFCAVASVAAGALTSPAGAARKTAEPEHVAQVGAPAER